MTRKPDLRTIVLLIVAGVYFTHLGRKRWKLLNRIKKTISSKIATTPLGEPAEIRAKVFSLPEDLTVSPLTQTSKNGRLVSRVAFIGSFILSTTAFLIFISLMMEVSSLA